MALGLAAADGAVGVTVYTAGELGFSCFRIPDLVVTSNGLLLLLLLLFCRAASSNVIPANSLNPHKFHILFGALSAN